MAGSTIGGSPAPDKRYSSCVQVQAETSLDEREYRCEHCDLNAAINLEQWLYLPARVTPHPGPPVLQGRCR